MFLDDNLVDALVEKARWMAFLEYSFHNFFLSAQNMLRQRGYFPLTYEDHLYLATLYEVTCIVMNNWRDPEVLLLSPPQLAPFVSTPRKAGPFFRAWIQPTQEDFPSWKIPLQEWNVEYLGTFAGVAS